MTKLESNGKGRSIRDAADARALLEQIQAAGQLLRPWCLHHGINPASLYHWRYKLQNEGRTPASAPAVPVLTFTEVRLPREPARYDLALPGNLTLSFDSSFRDDDLRRLLAVLRS